MEPEYPKLKHPNKLLKKKKIKFKLKLQLRKDYYGKFILKKIIKHNRKYDLNFLDHLYPLDDRLLDDEVTKYSVAELLSFHYHYHIYGQESKKWFADNITAKEFEESYTKKNIRLFLLENTDYLMILEIEDERDK